MTTHTQLINAFILSQPGHTHALLSDPSGTMIIRGDALVFESGVTLDVLAIRITNQLFVKNINTEILSKIPQMRYFSWKCKTENIYIERMSLLSPPYTNHQYIRAELLRTLEAHAISVVGAYCTSTPSNDLNKAQQDFKKEYKINTAHQKNIKILGALLSTHRLINRHGPEICNGIIGGIVKNITDSKQVIETVDKYLQVCITLPEISSPGTTAGRASDRETVTPAQFQSIDLTT